METIAVIGSRKGVDPQKVISFMESLLSEQPDAVVVSGGAEGVDRLAETFWIEKGGTVVSYRPRAMHKPNQEDSWAITRLVFNGANQGSQILDIPTFADRTSALMYRNTMIVDDADRVVSFQVNASPGTQFGKSYAKDRGKPVYEMVA